MDQRAIQDLHDIGLTVTAARCYLFLSEQHPYARRGSYITKHLGLGSSSTYRALSELIVKGFAEHHEIFAPAKYRAVPLSRALETYALYQRGRVIAILQAQHEQKT